MLLGSFSLPSLSDWGSTLGKSHEGPCTQRITLLPSSPAPTFSTPLIVSGAQSALEQAAINEAFLRRSELSMFELHCLVNRVAESQQKQEQEWQVYMVAS